MSTEYSGSITLIDASSIETPEKQYFWFLPVGDGYALSAGTYITEKKIDDFKNYTDQTKYKKGGYIQVTSNGIGLGKDGYVYTSINNLGLHVVKGGIQSEGVDAGPGTNNFVYLSTDYYSGTPTITINNHTSNFWKQIIGTKFGVEADGTLYASNVNISGDITTNNINATGGQIGGLSIVDNTIIINKIRTSAQDNYYAQITNNGLSIVKNSIEIGSFQGASARIGPTSSSHLVMGSNNLLFKQDDTTTLCEINTNGIRLLYNNENHYSKAEISGDGFYLYNDVPSSADNYFKAYITSNGARFYSEVGTDYVNIGTGSINFVKDAVNVGKLGYGYYKDNNNLYGLTLSLNRATTTKKPAYAGIVSLDANNNPYFRFIYLQDNASISGYTSGALNAGCNLDMNNHSIVDCSTLNITSGGLNMGNNSISDCNYIDTNNIHTNYISIFEKSYFYKESTFYSNINMDYHNIINCGKLYITNNLDMDDTSITNCYSITGGVTLTGGADATGGFTVTTGSLSVNSGSVYIPNNKSYASYTTGGASRGLMQLSSSNNYLFGEGSYANSEGSAYFEGNTVIIRSKGGNGVTLDNNHNYFRPTTANATACGTTTYYWTRFYANTAEWVKSDQKAKDVLGDLDFSKDLIMNLRPVQFMLKDSDHRRIHMGFIAQETNAVAKKINKNLSFIIADYIDPEKGEYLGEEANDEELTWGLSYTELIAPTIKVVQEQQKEIDELKQRIIQLEGGK